ncbi:60S ribosomal protein L27 [Bienertia sinuspersici]
MHDRITSIFNRDNESTLHLLRYYDQAKQVGTKICPRERSNEFFENEDLQHLLEKCLCDTNLNNEEDWAITFPLVCWWIWKWRNQILIKNRADIPYDRLEFLNSKIHEAKAALKKDNLLALMKIQRQEKLEAKYLPGLVGGGGLFGNHMGVFAGGSSLNLGRCTTIHAELKALLHGLRLGWDRGFKKLDVCMDNNACAQILNHNDYYRGQSLQVVKQCKEMLTNRAVDWLANKGVEQSELVQVNDHPPYILSHLLNEDFIGVAWARKALIILQGRYAGKKAVIVRNFDEGTRDRPYGHCLVTGISKYPKKVIRKDSAKKQAKKSRVKCFIKVANYNHIMPTRYTLDVDLKDAVNPDVLQSKDKKVTAAKEAKSRFEERFKSGKNRWFFSKLRF